MRDFLSTIQTIIIILSIVAGIAFISWGAFTLVQNADESQLQRYFRCLDKTEKQTCDKIFYKYKLKEL